MTATNGGGRTVESRVDLLEFRAGEQAAQLAELRRDMVAGFKDLSEKLDAGNAKSGRQLFATWMLVAALLSAAAAVFAAVH